jgi:hypothetical protein
MRLLGEGFFWSRAAGLTRWWDAVTVTFAARVEVLAHLRFDAIDTVVLDEGTPELEKLRRLHDIDTVIAPVDPPSRG